MSMSEKVKNRTHGQGTIFVEETLVRCSQSPKRGRYGSSSPILTSLRRPSNWISNKIYDIGCVGFLTKTRQYEYNPTGNNYLLYNFHITKHFSWNISLGRAAIWNHLSSLSLQEGSSRRAQWHDYREPGPHPVETVSQSDSGLDNCLLVYRKRHQVVRKGQCDKAGSWILRSVLLGWCYKVGY